MKIHRTYKGYVGVFRIDDDANVIRGKVVNTKDTITFQGQTFAEAVEAFRGSVDDYLDFCKDLGEAPEKPFSGKLLVRLRPEDHRALNTVAQAKGISVNRLVCHALRKVARGAAKLKPAEAADKGRSDEGMAAASKPRAKRAKVGTKAGSE